MIRKRNGILLLSILALGLGLWGCSKGTTLDEPAPAATADEAVRQVVQGLADGQPEVLWYALPASYQQDINAIVHEAAAQTDPELWNRTFGVLGKLSQILDEKRDFILDHPMLAAQMKDRGQAEKDWKAVVGLLDVVVKSDLADVDKVKKMDVGVFLADTGGEFMDRLSTAASMANQDAWGEFQNKMRNMKVTVVSSEGDHAMVRMESPGEAAKEEEFTRVEGKWIPKNMADEWALTMDNAREQLANVAGQQDDASKQMALMQLGMVEAALDNILAAKTAEDFNASIGGIMGMAMSAAMAKSGGGSMQMSPMGGSALSAEPFGGGNEIPVDSYEPPTRQQPQMQFSFTEDAGSQVAEAIPADPNVVDVDEAVNYVGHFMRVMGKDGMDFNGKLTAANDDTLVFERRFATGGTATFEVPSAEVDKLKINQR
jgi:hypothetical protein